MSHDVSQRIFEVLAEMVAADKPNEDIWRAVATILAIVAASGR